MRATMYPAIATATITGPEAVGDKLLYRFSAPRLKRIIERGPELRRMVEGLIHGDSSYFASPKVPCFLWKLGRCKIAATPVGKYFSASTE